jgi:LPXTG-motif cell wall-anchored protein
MDGTTTIRLVAGILFVIVLGVIIWRRRRKAIE